MALEPITRQEKIIAGQDLTPITRLEKFLKNFGGGGGGSVPKPLTYDYMPEGYPTKAVQTTTLMAEQEVAFAFQEGRYAANLTNAIDIVEGQTYTVNWDGTKYECVCSVFNSAYILGNQSFVGAGDDTGEPFLCINNPGMGSGFMTFDPSASHTISVKRIEETVTPMATEFLPDNVVGAQVVEITSDDGSTYTSSHTGAEINAMALKGAVVANIKLSGMEVTAAYFGCSQIVGEGFSVSFGACFTVGFADTSTGTASYGAKYFYVEPETKKVSFKKVSFT